MFSFKERMTKTKIIQTTVRMVTSELSTEPACSRKHPLRLTQLKLRELCFAKNMGRSLMRPECFLLKKE